MKESAGVGSCLDWVHDCSNVSCNMLSTYASRRGIVMSAIPFVPKPFALDAFTQAVQWAGPGTPAPHRGRLLSMPRSFRALPASILAVLLFVCGAHVVRDVSGEASAWSTISVADTHPSLHSSDSASRVDMRHPRRVIASVPALASVTPHRIADGAMVRLVTYGLVALRADRSAEARGYDATAPPHALR